jgi:hypothetical protein
MLAKSFKSSKKWFDFSPIGAIEKPQGENPGFLHFIAL